MKKILSLLSLFLAPVLCLAQNGTSQVSGNYSVNVAFTLQATNPIGTSQFPLAFQPLVSSSFSFGTNGIGIGHANQLFAAQFQITNGALVGTNVFNLHTMALSPGTAPNDYVGNAFSLLNVKFIAFQNLGTNPTASVSESNIVNVIIPGTGYTTPTIDWTNVYGLPFCEVQLPSPPGVANSALNNLITLYSPGNVGWNVGLTASNSILFTNPVSGTVDYVNVYVIGSTNQNAANF